MFLIWSWRIDTHTHTDTSSGRLLFNCFCQVRGFHDWAKLNLSPLYNLSSTEFHCPITLSVTVILVLLYQPWTFPWFTSGRWRMGAPSSYPHPTSHCPALGSGAFVFARGSVLCAHLPPSFISLLLHKLHCFASKGQQQMGAMQSHRHQQRGDGGVFSCAWTMCMC